MLAAAVLMLLYAHACRSVRADSQAVFRPAEPRAYLLLGTCDTGCHAGLWVQTGTWHESLYVFDGREPTLREWYEAQREATCWLDNWESSE